MPEQDAWGPGGGADGGWTADGGGAAPGSGAVGGMGSGVAGRAPGGEGDSTEPARPGPPGGPGPAGERAAGSTLHAWLDPATVALLNRLRLLGRRALAGRIAGPHRSSRKGSSLEFADYREYVRGDDPRRLDWRALARLDRPYIREYADERDRVVHLLLDGSASLGFGGKDRRLKELAAALAYVALRQGDRVEMTLLQGTTARRLASARGPAGRARVARALASLHAWQGATSLLPALLAWRGGAGAASPAAVTAMMPAGAAGAGSSHGGGPGLDRPGMDGPGTPATPPAASMTSLPAGGGAPGGRTASGGIAILISDLLDPASADVGEYARQVAGILAAVGEGAVVQVLAPEELDPEPWLAGQPGQAVAEWTLVDSETGSAREVTADGAMLAAYRQALSGWLGAWRAACHARGVPHALVSSGRPLRAVILEDLVPAGIVA